MTTDPRAREAAFRDLVTGLVDARVDLASARFDAELEAAEASGRLDPATARVLRWWQRESVRAVAEHARNVVPAALSALEGSAREAEESLARAEAAWRAARSVAARGHREEPPVPDTDAHPASAPAGPTAGPPPEGPPTAPPVSPQPPPPTDAPFRPGPAPSGPGPLPEHLSAAPRVEPPGPGVPLPPPDLPRRADDVPADTHAPRRRTLVAGLTVLPRTD